MSIPIILTIVCLLQARAQGAALQQQQTHANLTEPLQAHAPLSASYDNNNNNNNGTILRDTAAEERLESDPGTSISTNTIISIVVGVILILGAVGLLFWCGRRSRYPGTKRKSGSSKKGKGRAQDDASDIV